MALGVTKKSSSALQSKRESAFQVPVGTDVLNQHNAYKQKYAGTEYEKLFDSNPYLNLTYNPSVWDKIVGPSSKAYTTWLNNRDSNLASEDAKILAAIQQNEFNSPSEQAARMRAAGQNPDLLGTDSVESAADIAPDETPLEGNTGDPNDLLSAISTIGSGFVGCIEKGLNMALNYMSSMTTLDGLNLENVDRASSLADSMADSFVTPDDVLNPSEGVKRLTGLFAHRGVSGILDEFGLSDSDFRSRSVRQSFAKTIQRKYGSADYWNELLDKRKKSSGSTMDIATIEGHPMFRKDIKPAIDAMNEFLEKKVKVEMSLFDWQLHNNKYQSDFWQNKKGKWDAEYERSMKSAELSGRNLQNVGQGILNRNNTIQGGLAAFQYEQQKFVNQLHYAEYQFMDKLASSAKNGSVFSTMMLMGISSGRLINQFQNNQLDKFNKLTSGIGNLVSIFGK